MLQLSSETTASSYLGQCGHRIQLQSRTKCNRPCLHAQFKNIFSLQYNNKVPNTVQDLINIK